MLFIDWHDGLTYTYKEKVVREALLADQADAEAEAKTVADAGEEEVKAEPEAAAGNEAAAKNSSPESLEKKENDANKGVLNLSDCNLPH